MGMLATPIMVVASAWGFRLTYEALRKIRFFRSHGVDAPTFISRYVSCFHASALVILGMLWGAGFVEPGWWSALAYAIPIGYLSYDAHLICTEPTLWEASALAHHCIFALLITLAIGSYPDYTARAFLAELSVLPLNLGWIMFKTGAHIRWPQIFMVNSIVLLLTFLRFRVYTFTLFTIEAAFQGVWFLLPILASFAGLNWYWFILMCQKAYTLSGGRQANQPEE